MTRNWYETFGGGDRRATEGIDRIGQGIGTAANYLMQVDQRQRAEAQQNRPVGAGVNALLNKLYDKINARELSGGDAGVLYKLVQAGQLSEEQAFQMLGEGAPGMEVRVPPTPTGSAPPPAQVTTAPIAQGRPEVREPSSVPGGPMVPPPPVNPAAGASYQPQMHGPPMPTEPQKDLHQLMGRGAIGQAPSQHQWTESEAAQLQGLAPYFKERGPTDWEKGFKLAQEAGKDRRAELMAGQKDVALQLMERKLDSTEKLTTAMIASYQANANKANSMVEKGVDNTKIYADLLTKMKIDLAKVTEQINELQKSDANVYMKNPGVAARIQVLLDQERKMQETVQRYEDMLHQKLNPSGGTTGTSTVRSEYVPGGWGSCRSATKTKRS
jgi:hypothetical protein